jgi:hypothetical protein
VVFLPAIMQSLDPLHLARAIGTRCGFWPLDYDLTRAQWKDRAKKAAARGPQRFAALHLAGFRGMPSPALLYSDDLIRLALLPPELRKAVTEEIARIVAGDIEQGRLPTPPAWRRRKSGRPPVYQWERIAEEQTEETKPAGAETNPFSEEATALEQGQWPDAPQATIPERFHLVATLAAHGYRTAEIVKELQDRFGDNWPGQHEAFDHLPEQERRNRLRKLHTDTVLRDVKKARREWARSAANR